METVDESTRLEGVDPDIFNQILEMDDDTTERDFSRSIVFAFFDQAEGTFRKMSEALQRQDLAKLSELGHFLKGSSATLGLSKVKDQCEAIQQYGKPEVKNGNEVTDNEECLDKIKTALDMAEKDFKAVKDTLKKFYGEEDATKG